MSVYSRVHQQEEAKLGHSLGASSMHIMAHVRLRESM
jgi:hypothetical protein